MDSSTKNNFLWALVDRGGLLVFQFLALLYLANILNPYDFGLIAILNIFINISNVAVDSGMVGSLIKKEKVKPLDYNTLFTYNLALGFCLYITFFFLAPQIALFYALPELEKLIRILTISVILYSFSLVQIVKLNRQFKFKEQSAITVISQVLSVIIAVVLAHLGFGVWSLVSLQLTHIFFSTIMLVIVNGFIPRLEFSTKSFKEQIRFGGPLLFSNMIFIFNTNIYNSVIGKVLTARDSGYFYQSYKLQNTPTGILTAVLDKVGFTTLSKNKTNKDLIHASHKMNQNIYNISIPVAVYTYFSAKFLFLLILDDKWTPSAEIFKILSLSLVPLIIKILNRNLLKSSANTGSIFYLELINALTGLTILFQSINYGLEMVAYGIFILNLFTATLSVIIVNKKLDYKFSKQFSIIFRPLFISILTGLLIEAILPEKNLPLLKPIISGLIFALITIILLKKSKNSLAPV